MNKEKTEILTQKKRNKISIFWLLLLQGLAWVASPPAAIAGGTSMVLQSYDGNTVPLNKEGNQYPYWSDGRGGEGGFFTGSIDTTDAVSGNSFKAHLVAQAGTGNTFYAQFNPYDGTGRTFARDYCADPAHWQFNTYNRMSFWIKPPAYPAQPYNTDGTGNANVGGYAKCIALSGCPDYYSDETGGGHMYWNQNWPQFGTWVHVILNTWPDHWRGNSGGQEEPNALHATNESNYNLWDTFTRFYFQGGQNPQLPADYHIDEISFYQEVNPEAEEQVRSIPATYVPQTNRIIVTWFRNKDENSVRGC